MASALVARGRKRGDSRAHRQHLPFRDFVLRSDSDLLALLDAWSAASVQLRGTQGGQHGELKRIHVARAFYHDADPFVASANKPSVDECGDSEHRRHDSNEPPTHCQIVSGASRRAGRPNLRQVGITPRLARHQAPTSAKALVRAQARMAEGSEKRSGQYTRAQSAAAFRRSPGRDLASRRRLSDSASRVLAYLVTSGVPTVAAANARHRNRHHCLRPSDGLR